MIYIAYWGHNICGVYEKRQSAERQLRRVKASFPLVRSEEFWVHGPINVRVRGRKADRKAWY